MSHDKPQALDEAMVHTTLQRELPAWHFRDGHIVRRFETGGWRASLMIANAIGHLAELAWHHPDLHVTYPAVTVRLLTHEAGGISMRDIALAHRIEALVCWQPDAKHDGLTGIPDDPTLVYVRHSD